MKKAFYRVLCLNLFFVFYLVRVTVGKLIIFDRDSVLVYAIILPHLFFLCYLSVFGEESVFIFVASTTFQFGWDFMASAEELDFIIAVDVKDISGTDFELPERDDDIVAIQNLEFIETAALADMGPDFP